MIGWVPHINSDYTGYLSGKGKSYYGWLQLKWGNNFDLFIKNPGQNVLSSPKGPCFIPSYNGWYKVDFQRNNVSPLTKLRETEWVLNKWG
jgi:hypothetical protein